MVEIVWYSRTWQNWDESMALQKCGQCKWNLLLLPLQQLLTLSVLRKPRFMQSFAILQLARQLS